MKLRSMAVNIYGKSDYWYMFIYTTKLFTPRKWKMDHLHHEPSQETF